MRVLIADDDEDNREMYAEYLGMRGFSVGQAENGAVAVEYARRAKPDLIVMDLDMPVMDGIEAMTVLRDDAITSRIAIVVLSADGVAQHVRAERVGCSACLVKPCAPQLLEDVIRSIIESRWLTVADADGASASRSR